LLLVAGYEDGSAVVWDVEARTVLHRGSRHKEPMLCVSVRHRKSVARLCLIFVARVFCSSLNNRSCAGGP
jgi:hypothetical protein